MSNVKRLIIFAAAKGGVGKTTTARASIDLIRRNGRTLSAWDLDGQTGSLSLIYPDPDPTVGVGQEDIRDPRAPGKWLDAVHDDVDDVLLDVPGGALADLARTFDAGIPALVADVAEAERQIVLVSVVGVKMDSVASAQQAIEMFGPGAKHVVAKNGFFGDLSDFVIYDGTTDPATGEQVFGLTSKMVAAVNGEVVYLPRLNPIADALADVGRMSYADAGDATARIGRRSATNIRWWLAAVEEAFRGTWLDPAGRIGATIEPKVATVGGRRRG